MSKLKVIFKHSKKASNIALFSLKSSFKRKLPFHKIKVINLNAIDICNSKCQMCNIWKQKEDNKLDPNQFGAIFEDSLFSHVEHVGVTGGEPTLRDDLIEIYSVIIRKLSKLKGLSIITNAIRSDDVLEKVLAINELCKSKGISFNAMVSLDGVGKSHEKIRGTPDNFNNSIRVINELRLANIPTAIGCTISANNVWDVDELLYFLKKHQIYGRFRVAEFIKRLYNDNSKVIRSFNQDEIYQLAIFFHKLELSFETAPLYKRTYRNIRKMLLGHTRSIGCPYQTDGIVLGAEGRLSYCAPKSKEIGNALESSAKNLYKLSLDERERVFKSDCDNCIHDYHFPELFPEYLDRLKVKFQEMFFKSKHINKARLYLTGRRYLSFPAVRSNAKRSILILGWYGTETVGDKAILAGIIEHYKAVYQSLEITVASIVPYITERTVYELGYDIKVVKAQSFDLFKAIQNSDEVIMGGGPLMDLEELMIPYNGFLYAKHLNIKCTIFGCGIGPVHDLKYQRIVQELLILSDEIRLRDNASVTYTRNYLRTQGIHKHIRLSGDPAKHYLNAKLEGLEHKEEKDELCLFLREWTYEYARKYSFSDFERLKHIFEIQIRDLILSKARELKVSRIRFCHMHNFVMGNDDRDYSLKFIDTYLSDIQDIEIVYDKKLSTVESICDAMSRSRFNICMRFHSVVFAHTMNTNYLAIDYTLGGKIFNYLKDNNELSRLVEFSEVASK